MGCRFCCSRDDDNAWWNMLQALAASPVLAEAIAERVAQKLADRLAK